MRRVKIRNLNQIAMSDFEDSAKEINFDGYFQQDDLELQDDDFDQSEEQEPIKPTSSNKTAANQLKGQPMMNQQRQALAAGKTAAASSSKSPFTYGGGQDKDDDFDDDDYSLDESSAQKKAKQIQGKSAARDDFDDEDEAVDSNVFDNAFNYNKDEFKSDVEDSGSVENIPVTFAHNKQKGNDSNQDFNNFSIKQNQPPTKTVDNPFATKKNINSSQPIMQKQPTQGVQAQEIKFAAANDVNTDSDVGFDDDIQEDDHFSEQPIDDEFEESKHSQQSLKTQQKVNINQPNDRQATAFGNKTQDYGSTVNMASVVPNPKLVPINQTIMNTKNQNLGGTKHNSKEQNPFATVKGGIEMDGQSDIVPEIEYEQEDSMEDIHKKINAIPSRFSDLGSPEKQEPPKSTDLPKNSKSNTAAAQQKAIISQKREDSKSRPTTKENSQAKSSQGESKIGSSASQQAKTNSRVRPQTAKIQDQKRQNSRAPLPKVKKMRNNEDLGAVMGQDQEEEEKEEVKREEIKNKNGPSLIEKVAKNLLQSKANRLVLRPESAKPPKVGYDGNPNVLGKVKPISANHNDLTAQLAQSKKFQMIKKLKQEKERQKQELTVRNLKKANVIKEKQKQAKQSSLQQSKNASNSQIPKIQDEFEGDDFFEEAAMGEGDQAVGPGGGDMEDNEIRIGGAAGAANEDGFEDSLNQSVRQSVKDLRISKMPGGEKKAQLPQTQSVLQPPAQVAPLNSSQQQNRAQNQSAAINQSQGQGQGQGGTGTLKVTANQTPQALAMQKQREEAQANKPSMILGQRDEKFDEIQRQKKEKETNKDVLGFMLEKNQRVQQEKEQALQNQVNRLAKDFALKDVPKAMDTSVVKPSDKVPEHARLVIDDEKLAKELMDLKRRLKETNVENIKIGANIETAEKKKREKEALLDKIVGDKKLVSVNGQFMMQKEGAGSRQSQALLYGIKMEDIPDYDKVVKEKINPLESVVKKIESKGITLEQAFNLFDDDGNEILTKEEIKEGLRLQKIELDDTEKKQLFDSLDANADGVLTLDEWVNTLKPKYNAEKEFRQIMQNLDIDDPLIMEERILDLKYRSQRIEQELEVLREMQGAEQGYNYKDRMKRKLKNPIERKYAEKILDLETRVQDKMNFMLREKLEMMAKIQQSLMAKDEVQQNYYEIQRQQDRLDSEYSMRLQQIQDNLNVQDYKLNEVTQHVLMLKSDREGLKVQTSRTQVKITSLTELESKLDREIEQILGRAIDGKDLELLYELDMKTLRQLNSGSNQKFNNFLTYLSCVTIQRIFRGFIGRRDAKVWNFQRKRLARLLQPVVREKLRAVHISSAIKIQRMYRKYVERKRHLLILRQKAEQRRRLEEELDRNYKSQAELKAAVIKIQRRWREYKRSQTASQQFNKHRARNIFNMAMEAVHFPTVRVCYICKQINAARLCPSCQDCLYCEQCYVEYHARGHRRVHIYKRVIFGEKPKDERAEEEEFKKFQEKQKGVENRNPNAVKAGQAVTFNEGSINQSGQRNLSGNQGMYNLAQPVSNLGVRESTDSFKNDSLAQQTLLNTQLNAIQNQNDDDLIVKQKNNPQQNQLSLQKPRSEVLQSSNQAYQQMIKSTKSVRLTDEVFMRSVKKTSPLILDELSRYSEDEDTYSTIRLSTMKRLLLQNQAQFKLSADEVERFCEIAEAKCQKKNDGYSSDVLSTNIDLNSLSRLLDSQDV